MKLFRKRQLKSEIISQCSRIIQEINSLTGWGQTEIANRLGVSHRTIWGAQHGETGSNQLLKALELLRQSIDHNAMDWPDDHLRRMTEARARGARLSVENFCMWSAILFGDDTLTKFATNSSETLQLEAWRVSESAECAGESLPSTQAEQPNAGKQPPSVNISRQTKDKRSH